MSLLELLVVIGIISGLAALLIPAVFHARQQAQVRACAERIRELSFAINSYEAARKRIPPGILGFDEVINFDDTWFNSASPFHWKRAQFTSWLALTLPYLGVGDYLVDYDRIAINERLLLSDVKNPTTGLPRYEGFQAIPGFGDLAAKTIPEFRCPSDHLEPCNELRSVFGALQVCWREGVPDRMLTFRPLLEDPSGEFGLTNYAGCTGSHFGGFVPGDDEGNAGRGMMTYRRGLPMSKIIDGLSNTVMLGETIGQVQAGKRLGAQNWLVGGLAKGGKNLDTPYPALGRINNAYWTGFSSVHAGGVWLSFGDCHVELFNRQTDEVTLESLCGIADARNSN